MTEDFSKCDFSIDGVNDDFEVIDGSVMSCDDIQAIEDKYPGIFTTPDMSINMKVVPLDNHMHFCNLDFTQGPLPVPSTRQPLGIVPELIRKARQPERTPRKQRQPSNTPFTKSWPIPKPDHLGERPGGGRESPNPSINPFPVIIALLVRFIDWLNNLVGADKPKRKDKNDQHPSWVDVYTEHQNEEPSWHFRPVLRLIDWLDGNAAPTKAKNSSEQMTSLGELFEGYEDCELPEPSELSTVNGKRRKPPESHPRFRPSEETVRR